VKSLVSHPASMTHKSIETEKRRAAGVSDSLIRLSVGLEDAQDLIDDIENALRKVGSEQLAESRKKSNTFSNSLPLPAHCSLLPANC
jgi:cysteine-S-conjugate beta-lyase